MADLLDPLGKAKLLNKEFNIGVFFLLSFFLRTKTWILLAK